MRGETVSSLLSNNYFPGVSLFHDFRGIAAPNFSRRFRLCLTQLTLQLLFLEIRETAEQRLISTTRLKACLFRPVLKQGETACNSRCPALARPAVQRNRLGAQRRVQ